jgi:calcium channel MID1
MLLFLYFAFSFPQFAYAAEVDSVRPEDHNHDRLHAPFLEIDYDDLELRETTYEAEFVGVDRGIIGRATTDPLILPNNEMVQTNVPVGGLVSYMFSNASLWSAKAPATPGLPSQITLQGRSLMPPEYSERNVEEEEDEVDEELKLRRRQSSSVKQRPLYITATTCDVPESNSTTKIPPQLQLYVSTSSNNTNPGPTQPSNLQEMVELVNGYILHQINASGDVFMSIYAKNDSSYIGAYNVEIAASIDAPYHYYWDSSDPNLFLKDSDDASALLFTDPFMTNSSNLTLYEEWMSLSPGPFTVFLSDANSTAFSLKGVERSYCGLQAKAEIVATRPGQTQSKIVTGMTNIGEGALPRQQFYVSGLSPGRKYYVALAMNGNSTASGKNVVGGGGQVFNMTSFETLQGMVPFVRRRSEANLT